MSALLYFSINKCGKLSSPCLTRMKSQTVYIYKNVFDYIPFQQLVLEIYDLGKSLFYFNLNQADLHVYIQR